MSSPDFYLCDICGERVPQKLRMWITTGREMDAAGSMDDVGSTLDLCHKHAIRMLELLLKDKDNPIRSDYDQGKRLLETVRRQVRVLCQSK